MRVPQVSERIKEVPAEALRGVFAGMGKVLLITDKLRNKPPADTEVPQARAPQPSETMTDTTASVPAGQREEAAEPAPAEPAPAEPPKPPKLQKTRDFDKTWNVRLLSRDEGAAADSPASPVSAAPPVTPVAPVSAAPPVTPVAPVSPAAPVTPAAPESKPGAAGPP